MPIWGGVRIPLNLTVQFCDHVRKVLGCNLVKAPGNFDHIWGNFFKTGEAMHNVMRIDFLNARHIVFGRSAKNGSVAVESHRLDAGQKNFAVEFDQRTNEVADLLHQMRQAFAPGDAVFIHIKSAINFDL